MMIGSVNRTLPAYAAPMNHTAAASETASGPVDSASLSGLQDKAAPGKPEYAPGQVLVKFAPGTSLDAVDGLAEDLGLSVIRHFDVPEVMVEKFGGELYQFGIKNGQTVEEMVAKLSGRQGVAYAEPNYLIQVDDGQETPPQQPPQQDPPTSREPNDLHPKLWGLKNTGQEGGRAGVDINASGAWAKTTGGTKETAPLIAVIDTGIDYNHPDLAANMWTNPGEIAGDGIDNDGNGYVDDVHGANMITGSGDPMDDNRHGSHCAGTIGGVGDNGQGVVGVNWTANMAGVKFLSGSGGGTYADAIEAVLYSSTIGARVTSNSWGGTGSSDALRDAFAASPAIHIAAAGNSGVDADRRPHYPSGFDLDNIVSVAAHDRNDRLASFSNWGRNSVDVAAPGVDVYSTVPGGGYQSLSGTSMATPHVAGVVGLMLADNPELTNEQIKSRLIGTTIKTDAYQGKMVGNGRVNAVNVMETDEVPPATPLDFHIADIGATGISVGWSATGDDGMEGNASSYQLRVSSQPITEEGGEGTTSWANAQLASTPLPAEPGSPEEIRVGIEASADPQTYHFALKVFDNMGNASGMVTGAARSKAAAVAFSDNFDAEGSEWTAEHTWAKVDVEGRGKVYTDSPDGAYDNDVNASLTSKAFDLSAVGSPVLKWNMKHDLEANFDKVHVEVTADGGESWTELAAYDGLSDWASHSLDLSAYEDQTVQVRFRVTSDRSIQKDGVYVDDVQVAGDPKVTCPTPPPCECPPPDQGEQPPQQPPQQG